MALTFTPQPEAHETRPDFALPAVDGSRFTSEQLKGAPASVIMFICNHCPYVQAIEDRLIQLGRDLKNLSVPVVAICSNDSSEHPDDSFSGLKERWQKKSYPFPYLHDESQAVAMAFGAVCTPDFFVYDAEGRLCYRGRLDDSWKDESRVTRRELFEAVQNILAKKPLAQDTRPAMGCSIKWKNQDSL